MPQENHLGGICILGNSSIALLMVKTGSFARGVDIKDELGDAPLITASAFGLEEVVVALIEAGADINIQGNEGGTPHYVASQDGHLEVVKELLRRGSRSHSGCSSCLSKEPSYGTSESESQSEV